jgi:diguanylate cyclase (GGDEF)-like protein
MSIRQNQTSIDRQNNIDWLAALFFILVITVASGLGYSTKISFDQLEDQLISSVVRRSPVLNAINQSVNNLKSITEAEFIQTTTINLVRTRQQLNQLISILSTKSHSSHSQLESLARQDLTNAILEILNFLQTAGLDESSLTTHVNRLVENAEFEFRERILSTHRVADGVTTEHLKRNLFQIILVATIFLLGVVVLFLRRRSAESRVSAMKHRMVDSIETIGEGFVLFDVHDNLVLCNSRFRRLFNLDVRTMLYNMSYREVAISLIQSDTYSVSGYYYQERLNKFLQWHREPVGFFELEHSSGLVFRISEHRVPNGDTVGIFHDVTQLVEAHKHVEQLARHDHITGLYSRAYFEELTQNYLQSANQRGIYAALIFIDLDRFKIINDSFGHPSGDSVLKHVSNKLKEYASPKNIFARYGGDEFALLVNELPAGDTAMRICRSLAENILRTVSGSVSIGAAEAYITASIGISIYPTHGTSLKSLIHAADTAAYYAKSLGGGNVQQYNKEMQLTAYRKVELERNLRMALSREEIFIEFQPLVDLHSGKIIGLEALVRWNSKALGSISPSEFIPLSEETGLIFSIGNWILREVCRHIAEWKRQGFDLVPVSINLSARQFRDKNLFSRIHSTLSDFNLMPESINIEITETTILENIENAVETVNRLTDIGVKLSIDDFGTDYSSMSSIKRFDVDTIKIDQSFIHDMESDSSSLEIVSAMINMAHNMNMKVVAEGVENEVQLKLLESRRCDYVQGFYFSRAITAQLVPNLLRDNDSQPANQLDRFSHVQNAQEQ